MGTNLGKIPSDFFNRMVRDKLGAPRKEVTVPAQFGVDVSVIDLAGGNALLLTSDPLSLIPSMGLQESAWLSVHLMANDMATTGFAPMYGQFVLNLPAGFSEEDFRTYWDYIHQFCAEIGISVTGGHTGFVEGQNSTIAGGGTLVAVAPRDEVLVSSGARPGDSVLVTKTSALSSAAILAMSFPETIRQNLGKEIHQRAEESFYQTSSLKDALVAAGVHEKHPEVTAMHDVTEGGVLGAIYEMAVASGSGVLVKNDQIPVGEVQREICELFELDSRYCIGAGSMIIACQPGTAGRVVGRLKEEGIACVEVGTMKDFDFGMKIEDRGELQDLIYHENDPYWAAFYNAIKQNWK